MLQVPEYNKCLVLGLSLTTLGIIRSLGRKGIKVLCLDFNLNSPYSSSKFCKTIPCPSPEYNEKELIDLLNNLAKIERNKLALFSTNDKFVIFMSRNQLKLRKYYNFVIPDKHTIQRLNDKEKFYQLAKECQIEVPETFFPKSSEDIKQLSTTIKYPCILKPSYGHLYSKIKLKGFVARNQTELFEGWTKFKSISKYVILQEFVSSNDDIQYSFCAYINKNSEPLALFSAKKIRQNPPETGVGTLVKSCYESDVIKLGTNFLKMIGYTGIVEIEFKRDKNNNKLKMIEVNTRSWGQIGLAVRCGIDIPYIAYCDACGMRVKAYKHKKIDPPISWLNLGGDLEACFSSRGYLKKNKITYTQWAKSLTGPKEYAIFSVDDILPFLRSIWDFGLAMIKRIVKNKII